jgi:beta-glucosidase
MHEIYLPPFRAAVEAGVAAIMPAFMDVDGVPMTANAAILRDVVRGEWGFDGVLISDYSAVAELVAHGVAEDLADAAALALAAGVDINMMGGGAYADGLPLALKRGKIGLDAIDASVRRVLELKAKLGLFADPYRRCKAVQAAAGGGAPIRQLARDAACRSIVLLKNRDGALPLGDARRSVAVIGPLANAGGALPEQASAAGSAAGPIAVIDGLSAALSSASLSFAAGSGIERIDAAAKSRALELAGRSDITILCLGETPSMSGEAGSRARPDLPAAQCELARAVIALEKPVIVLLFSGRPLILPDWLVAGADALLASWFLGSEAGPAIGDVLSGRFNPSGRLCMSWPVDVGQIPVFFAERPPGRPPVADVRYSSKYLDIPNEPLFGFGHGLSYGEFRIEGLRVDRSAIRAGEFLHAEVEVANLGAVAGEETIFLFTHDPVASLSRPFLELKDFRKIALAPGERGTVRFRLDAEALGFVGPDLALRLEPGAFDLHVGRNVAKDALLSTRIELLA